MLNAVSTRLVALCLVGASVLTAGATVRSEALAMDDETTILLLADGPLASEPARTTPPLELADAEILLNGEIVPEVTIQTGLLMRPLYVDSAGGRSFSVVEWPADISLKRHWHPVTERVWMVEGSIASPEDGEVGPGMFWEAPARVAMGPFTSSGSVFAFLGEGPFETYYLGDGEEAPGAGTTKTVDPDTIPWRPLNDVLGADVEGSLKVLSPQTETDRGVYLVRFDGSTASAYMVRDANLEGYVLSGSLRLSDPFHGDHLLASGFYFRLPAGFPASLSVTPMNPDRGRSP